MKPPRPPNSFSLPPNGILLPAGVALCVILFWFSRSSLFALGGFLLLIAWLASDIAPRAWTTGEIASTGKEVLFAFLIAFAAWTILQTVFSSPAPLDVVTSCSMLPDLQRGDLILVAGGTVNAPRYTFSGPASSLTPQLSVSRHACTMDTPAGVKQQACTDHVLFAGTSIPLNHSNDVLVFESGLPTVGLIVHRSVAQFTNGTNTYFLTKGDNNPNLDQESLLPPIDAQAVHGRVIGRVPLIGFLKLFLFLQFSEPENCKTLLHP